MIAAVVPTRYERTRLLSLLKIVVADCDVLIVLDNGHQPPIPQSVNTRGMGIYAQWNLGWKLAREAEVDYVAILNDDIRMVPGTLPILARALDSDPTLGVSYPDKYTPNRDLPTHLELSISRDPKRDRTLTGFCFMARLSMIESSPFDEKFHWWFGDDAFDRRVRDLGFGVAKVLGLPITHQSDSEKDNWARRPELRKLAQQDLARWQAIFEEVPA